MQLFKTIVIDFHTIHKNLVDFIILLLNLFSLSCFIQRVQRHTNTHTQVWYLFEQYCDSGSNPFTYMEFFPLDREPRITRPELVFAFPPHSKRKLRKRNYFVFRKSGMGRYDPNWSKLYGKLHAICDIQEPQPSS